MDTAVAEHSRLALAAVRAGIDDVEVAFGLGQAGSRLTGEPLYNAVRTVTVPGVASSPSTTRRS